MQVSAEQVKDLGAGWVILGHSERRALIKESNDFVGEKVAHALEQGLKVIACIGETLEQRESGKAGATFCSFPCNTQGKAVVSKGHVS